MHFLPHNRFRQCVDRYKGNRRVRSFSCSDQYLCMAFAQLTYRESLRDIECCLRAFAPKLYHMGIRGQVSRTTLADANENRDWRIYRDFAHVLIQQARALYKNEEFGVELDQTVYALDASTIDLCLALFPWANFRSTKAAIKLHTLLDLRGNIPTFIEITDGKVHDVNILDILIPEAGSTYVMDRGYLDFKRLYKIHQSSAFFIIRKKTNTVLRRLYSRPVDKTTGLRCDQTVALTGPRSKKDYPQNLRLVKYHDIDSGKKLTFLTNQFSLPALSIAQLYRCRWSARGGFFKWIKQHLRIKAFYGLSENAVKTQIWIAVSVYVLMAIIKKQLQIDLTLYTILQVFSVTLFEKIQISRALAPEYYKVKFTSDRIQLKLFDS